MTNIFINTRALHHPLTGVQRYILALLNRFGNQVETVSLNRRRSRYMDNAWEQIVLPLKLGSNSVLFSPSNSGPLLLSNQVVTIHDVAQLDRMNFTPELNDQIDSRSGAWYRFLTPRLVRRVAHIITTSEFSKERILSHIKTDPTRITVIPNGVDARFHPQNQAEITSKLSALNLPSQHYILCVGSLEPRKNLTRLLQAWANIQSKVPQDIWLVLTGQHSDERYFANILGLDNMLTRTHFTGHIPDNLLPMLYAGALLFVFPSVYEGFGLPPLEAMASGTPVLTGNCTSLPEVVGDAGYMVDPYNIEARIQLTSATHSVGIEGKLR